MARYVFTIELTAAGIPGAQLIDLIADALDESEVLLHPAVGLDADSGRLSLLFVAEGAPGENAVSVAQRAFEELARVVEIATGTNAQLSGGIELEAPKVEFRRIEVLVG